MPPNFTRMTALLARQKSFKNTIGQDQPVVVPERLPSSGR